MSRSTRVDFHCHSTMSDGYASPEEMAQRLAAAHVHYAALTDHETIDGVAAFRHAAEARGIACVTGAELTVIWRERPIHLLAYGFDPTQPALRAWLEKSRGRWGPNSVLGRFGRVRSPFRPRTAPPETEREEPNDDEPARLIELIHAVGGRAFLAHPLTLNEEPEALEPLIAELKTIGLDGIEAFYKPYPHDVQQMLYELAERLDLMVTGGSDYHGNESPRPIRPGVVIPTTAWHRFRDSLAGSPKITVPPSEERRGETPPPKTHGHPNGFLWRIVLPSLLTLGLFVATYFAIVIPTFERVLLDRKKETIRELTNSAISILAEYERDAREGQISMEEAQRRALQSLRFMRYGDEQKDYFWVTDEHPRMLMHPYLQDLNGQDLTDFRDPNGVRLFVEFANIVRARGEGYVEYVWQWKDNPDRIEAKESYVKGFKPWGWIVGTGLYIEDVRAEIGALTERLVSTAFVILVMVGLLLLFLAQQSLRTERNRRRIEEELVRSHEKYKALVEAAREGTMMVLDGRCTYSNATLLEMTGHSPEEFQLLGLADVLPETEIPDHPLARYMDQLARGDTSAPPQVEAQLRRKDGTPLDVLVAATRVRLAKREGFIVNTRDIRIHKKTEEQLGETRRKYRRLTDTICLGVFRLSISEDPNFIEINPAARRIFGLPEDTPPTALRFFETFHDPEDRENLLRIMLEEKTIENRIVRLRKEDGSVPVVSISGVVIRDAEEKPRFFDGIAEDITDRAQTDSERDQLIAELQTSLLFLNEPIKHSMRPPMKVDMMTPLRAVCDQMVREKRRVALVAAGSGEVIGIVTEHDFVKRAMAEDKPENTPVHLIMSAPVISIAQTALTYEAILLMQEKGLRHLAIRDSAGAIAGVIENKELLQFNRYSATVLTLAIRRAQSIQEIVTAAARLPQLIKALMQSGARPRNMTRLVSTISDTTVSKLVALAIDRIGPPPLRFAFVALGSEGREEQTLVTDQDNAIIYEDPPAGMDEEARQYFETLARHVCEGLSQAGYAACKAGMMASNPQWCRPLSAWKKYFSEWINTDDPRDFLDINIFFDYRCVEGDRRMTAELRHHIGEAVKGKAAFFHHFAQTVLLYKPPLGLFGQLLVKSSGSAVKTLNIKDAISPIVNFARIYALLHNLDEVNTCDRLQRLFEQKVITKASLEEILTAYNYLMRIRIEHQVRNIDENRPPDNQIDPHGMPQLEEAMLKQSLGQIATIQKQIRFDFSGLM